ncbi:MAG: porin family protein [Gammaproteobacteria bacterium]|nr:porin family protein [Gammaproteobacteria bacterium]MCH9744342.1 porin family protein [Gammaproteobacteria bacterium]
MLGKRLFTILILIFSSTAYCSEITRSGLYLGADAGYSTVNYTTSTFPTGFAPSSIDKAGAAAKIYMGYTFKKYYDAELDVIYFKQPSFTGISGITHAIKIRNNIISLSAKGMLPLSNRIAPYVTLGIGYIARTGVSSGSTTVLPEGCFFSPVYGAGLIWNFYKNWNTDFNWTQAPQNSSKRLPTANFVAAGIFYKF